MPARLDYAAQRCLRPIAEGRPAKKLDAADRSDMINVLARMGFESAPTLCEGRTDAYVASLWTTWSKRRTDAGDPAVVDPDELAARGARGENSAVRSPGAMPALDTVEQVKRVAASIGAYSPAIRDDLMTAVLYRMRELFLSSLADKYEEIWAEGFTDENVDGRTDTDERAAEAALARRSALAHCRADESETAIPSDTDEQAAAERMRRASAEMSVGPRGRTREQVLDEMNPNAARRRRQR